MLNTSYQSLRSGAPVRHTLYRLTRPLLPRRLRWFYEGNPHVSGQLWRKEREFIWQTIRNRKPAVCFEIGTWEGGGSTLYIADALRVNGAGILHTVEIDKEMYSRTQHAYANHLPDLTQFVKFYTGDYSQVFRSVLEAVGRVDLLMLDGAEDGHTRRDALGRGGASRGRGV